MSNRTIFNMHESFMEAAIEIAQAHGTPYGCVIHNTDTDESIIAANTTKINGKTAHAEIEAIRQLSDKNWAPENLTIYTTGEPCPMCMGAIIWSGITKVYYGVSITKISKYHRQIQLSSIEVASKSWLSIFISGGLLEEKCLTLFDSFAIK